MGTGFSAHREDPSAVPVLEKHMEFLLESHRRYHSGEEPEPKPATLGDTFSTLWTLQKAQDVLAKGIFHISQVGESMSVKCTNTEDKQSCRLFDPLRDWVLEQLDESSGEDR